MCSSKMPFLIRFKTSNICTSFQDGNVDKDNVDHRFYNEFLNQTYNFSAKWRIEMVTIDLRKTVNDIERNIKYYI